MGIGAAFAVATLAGLQGLSTSNPALAKLVYGVVGLPCGLLMTATTVASSIWMRDTDGCAELQSSRPILTLTLASS